MSHPRRDHPDMRDQAPGRIPESLIDAAMDGELDAQIQREIGHALQYDPARRQEFHDTRDAINALRMPIDMPDLSDRVLERANRHRRFIPRKLRQQVRAGRVVMCAALLTTLLAVAGLQRMYPRLTTIAAQQTPVRDIELAVEQDRNQIVDSVHNEVGALRATIAPVAGLFDRLDRPGINDARYGVEIRTASVVTSQGDRFPAGQLGTHAYAVYTIVNHRPSVSGVNTRRSRLGLLADAPMNRVALTSWTTEPDAPRVKPVDDPLDLP